MSYPDKVNSDRHLRYLLKRAVEEEDQKAVERLLSRQSKSDVAAAAALSDGSNLLHYACRHGYCGIAVHLVKSGGAELANCLDADLNTPLHVAVRRLTRHRSKKSWQAMAKVILGLVSVDTHLYDAENSTGMSPRHLLQPLLFHMKQKDSTSDTRDYSTFIQQLDKVLAEGSTSGESGEDAETEWREKMMHSVLEDVDEADGSEWRFFDDGYVFELPSDYMTRLGDHLANKHRPSRLSDRHQPRAQRRRAEKPPSPKRKCLGPLKPEKPEIVVQPVLSGKDLDLKFLELLRRSKEEGVILHDSDIPWPCRGSADEMVHALLAGVERHQLRQHVHRLLRRWHPDKFSQYLGKVLAPDERDSVLQQVTSLSQALTARLSAIE